MGGGTARPGRGSRGPRAGRGRRHRGRDRRPAAGHRVPAAGGTRHPGRQGRLGRAPHLGRQRSGQLMRGKGINYDTGFLPGEHDSRPDFDLAMAAAEMRVIARELGCTAVRVSGSRPERISIAAQAAAAEGLEVWFAPFPPELTTAELIELFRHGKPVVATEYGCCPYAGAADKGGLGWDIAD